MQMDRVPSKELRRPSKIQTGKEPVSASPGAPLAVAASAAAALPVQVEPGKPEVSANPSAGRVSLANVPSASGQRGAGHQVKKRDHLKKRDVVNVSGKDRPIRLDTQEGLSDQLNTIVRDVRHAEIFKQSGDYARQRKLRSLGSIVDGLTEERLSGSLARRDIAPEGWHSVNVRKHRTRPEDPLCYVVPERRQGLLRAIEGCVAWPVFSQAHDSSGSLSGFSSTVMPSVSTNASTVLSGPTLPTPGGHARRPVRPWA